MGSWIPVRSGSMCRLAQNRVQIAQVLSADLVRAAVTPCRASSQVVLKSARNAFRVAAGRVARIASEGSGCQNG